MKDNIAIIGFMGSGKTTIGKLLADKLSFLFIDFDRVIELYQCRTISDIFSKEGEDYFRKIESEVIMKLLNNRNCVFACGGGTVIRRKNMERISRGCEVVYIMISPEEAFNRLSQASDRPLLPEKKRKKTISDLLEKRQSQYLEYATITIDNNDATPEDAVETIIRKLKPVINPMGHV